MGGRGRERDGATDGGKRQRDGTDAAGQTASADTSYANIPVIRPRSNPIGDERWGAHYQVAVDPKQEVSIY